MVKWKRNIMSPVYFSNHCPSDRNMWLRFFSRGNISNSKRHISKQTFFQANNFGHMFYYFRFGKLKMFVNSTETERELEKNRISTAMAQWEFTHFLLVNVYKQIFVRIWRILISIIRETIFIIQSGFAVTKISVHHILKWNKFSYWLLFGSIIDNILK